MPLEPRAAVAEWEDGTLTVWTGTQRPFGVRSELAEAFRIPEEKVRVIVPDTGSGYGGKHTGEAAIEAARLAKAAGRPVKVVWTREEEFTWAYFRPGRRHRRQAAASARTASSRPGSSTTTTRAPPGSARPTTCRTSRSSSTRRASPLRQGSYRGLAATANHFARESHMDELAHALGLDPLEFRLKNLSDARLRAVLEAAAEKFGWGKTKATAERGFGIACGVEKGGYVATCAEVAIARPSGEVRVTRAVTAFECGAIVNPDHLQNQVEGAVVMGLGGALFEAIQFDDGRGQQPDALALPRAALLGRAGARDRAARPQGPALGGRRRDADHRPRAGGRGRALRGDGHAAAQPAPGPERGQRVEAATAAASPRRGSSATATAPAPARATSRRNPPA